MLKNRIREFRQKKGLSRKQLAEATGVSPLLIQRIETGAQDARSDLAARISRALGQTAQAVFPETGQPPAGRGERRGRPVPQGSPLAKAPPGKASPARVLHAKDAVAHELRAVEEPEEAGLDMDPEVWFFKYRLRGGEAQVLPVTGPENRRLQHLVQDGKPAGFAIFDSGSRRYGLNLNHLLYARFLFEPPGLGEQWAEDDDDPDDSAVRLFFIDGGEPLVLNVEPDDDSLEAEGDPDPESVQLQSLFLAVESECDCRVCLTDVDGETAFINMKEVSIFSAPLACVEPGLLDALEDDKLEAADGGGRKSSRRPAPFPQGPRRFP